MSSERKLMPQLFLDCDGVLADFDTLATAVFGLPSRDAETTLGTKRFWVDLQSHPDFFGSLELMPDAKELVEATRHLNPIILTGTHHDWAREQKKRWQQENFPELDIIMCPSKDKRLYMQPGDVLVDDWLKYRHLWVEAGGIFIHHTSAKSSIAQLKTIGML